MRWGPAAVAALIAQRRPFVMLDRITGWSADALEGCRHITANDPIFDGHFDGFPLWPGVLTIEGLAQAASALMGTVEWTERIGVDALLEALDHLELGATMQPGYDAARVSPLGGPTPRSAPPGLFGAADVKLLAPVFPGCRLDYRVRLQGRYGDLVRFECEATVDDRRVAAGTLSGSRVTA